ncbi:MAG: DNA polymerase III subunit gamma/tau [Lachnospiraceae bacterium]|nr:DNA polymerase III subunit gamma/tau [Lachnospiraceae bacterium]
MSYTALYRKFRPQTFTDVKGQDPIVTTLKNQIKADRIGHAYLFCGTRGTGKTSVAKIFARAVNCQHPVDGSPCMECEVCKSIAEGSALNVIEIDAASNNGVDNIREIREEVTYSPTVGRFKVYIIDEVHMLSAGAFNALLKTLEEPPAYVIFILATTEIHKIPVTILSRCQRYDFRRISIDTIAGRLTDLLAKENVQAEEKAVRYIAKVGDGSMRDALSLLDQCIAFYLGQELTYDKVLEVLGAVDTEIFARLLSAVLSEDVPQAMQIVEELTVSGRELTQFAADFCWYLRNLLLMKSADDMEELLDISSENLETLKAQAAQVESTVLMRYIRVISTLINDLKYSSQKRILTEVALIKLCKPAMETDTGSLTDRILHLEEKMENGVWAASPAGSVPGQGSMAQAAGQNGSANHASPAAPKAPLPKAIPAEVEQAVRQWRSIVNSMNVTGMTKTFLNQAHLSVGEGETGTLLIVLDDYNAIGICTEEETKKALEEAIESHLEREVKVEIRENKTGKPAGETYPDLKSLLAQNVKMEIETEE